MGRHKNLRLPPGDRWGKEGHGGLLVSALWDRMEKARIEVLKEALRATNGCIRELSRRENVRPSEISNLLYRHGVAEFARSLREKRELSLHPKPRKTRRKGIVIRGFTVG